MFLRSLSMIQGAFAWSCNLSALMRLHVLSAIRWYSNHLAILYYYRTYSFFYLTWYPPAEHWLLGDLLEFCHQELESLSTWMFCKLTDYENSDKKPFFCLLEVMMVLLTYSPGFVKCFRPCLDPNLFQKSLSHQKEFYYFIVLNKICL